jgi:hypothetical protein
VTSLPHHTNTTQQFDMLKLYHFVFVPMNKGMWLLPIPDKVWHIQQFA